MLNWEVLIIFCCYRVGFQCFSNLLFFWELMLFIYQLGMGRNFLLLLLWAVWMYILIVIVLLCVCSSIDRRLFRIWLLWYESCLFSFISLFVLSLFVLFFIVMVFLRVSFSRFFIMSFWLLERFVLSWRRIISQELCLLWCRSGIIYVFFVQIKMSGLGRVGIFLQV